MEYSPSLLFQNQVQKELERARELFAPINSGHEAYAVILEEVTEFWEFVRSWKGGPLPAGARKELLQIATMAQRAAEDLSFEDS